MSIQTTSHLPLSEQPKTIQIEARLEAIAETSEHCVQTVELAEIMREALYLKCIHLSDTLKTRLHTFNQREYKLWTMPFSML